MRALESRVVPSAVVAPLSSTPVMTDSTATGVVDLAFADWGPAGLAPLLPGPTPPPDTLSLSVPAKVSIGEPFTFTVTALDSTGATDTSFLGTVHFSSSDSAAALPANYTFTVSDAGQHTFSATLSTLGSQTLSVSDPAGVLATQTASLTVVADTFHVTIAPSVTVGESFSFSVVALGPSGKPDPEFQGNVHFTSSDPTAVLPADYSFLATDAGKQQFAATLSTLGTQTITASDPAGITLSAFDTTTVAPNTYTVTTDIPKASASVAFQLTVNIIKPGGGVDGHYLGTIHFASTDPGARLPADYTFQLTDHGVHTFLVDLYSTGQPTITVSDPAGIMAAVTITEPVESGPQLAAIPDQQMLLAAGSLTLTIPAPTDADGDLVTLAQPAVSGFSAAYDLRQRLGLYEYVGPSGPTYFENLFGQQEKWLFGAIDGNRYLILPTGEVRQYVPGRTQGFAQTTLVASFDPRYWLDPTLLTNATQPAAPAVTATVNPTTHRLTITPPAQYTGTFRVTITAADDTLSASQSFLVTVTDDRPSLAPIADQTMPHSQGSLQVTLHATDPDPGDTVLFATPLIKGFSPAAELQQRLGLHEYVASTGPTFFQSPQWNNGKWLLSATTGGRYLILPTGQILEYTAGAASVADLAPVTTLDPSVWVNPALLTSAVVPAAPPGVAATITGDVLTITVPAAYVGTFRVTVTATDGTLNTGQTFLVHVTDAQPVLQAIADQTVAPGTGSLKITLSANDPDAGDSISFLPPMLTGSSPAYDVQRLLGLYVYQGPNGPSYWQASAWGTGKWLFSALTGNRYLIQSTGKLLQYVPGATTLADLIPVAQLAPSIYTDPTLLTKAPVPPAPAGVIATIHSGVLTISLPAGYTGTFRVSVTAADGAESSTESFLVHVTNGLADDTPVLAALPDLMLDHTQTIPSIALQASDTEQTPTLIQPLTRLAGPDYDLQQQLGLYAYQGTAGPNYFQTAQWDHGKWLFSALDGGRYVILSTGQVFKYVPGATTVADLLSVAQLDPGVYLAPTLLTRPAPLPIGASIQNASLSLTPLPSFSGSFWTTVLATDGIHLTTQQFLTTITDQAPLVGQTAASSLPDVVLTRGAGPWTTSLKTLDGDGDPVTLRAALAPAGPAADLEQQLGLYEYVGPNGPTFLQSRTWSNGKWLFSAVNGGRYLILPDGTVKQWVPGATTVAQLADVTTLDPSIYSDPTLLVHAPMPAITLSSVGNSLTITPPANYAGSFRVFVTASDGLQTTVQSFVVTVTDESPELSTLPFHVQTPMLPLPPTNLGDSDPDGDPVTVLVGLTADNSAVNLQQQLGLYAWQGVTGPNYLILPQWNNAKWFWSAVNGQRYLLLPNGQLREWAPGETTVADTTPVVTFDAAVYLQPTILTRVAAVPVTASLIGSTLTITPQAGAIGTFWVNVLATDGVRWTTQRFWVAALT